jgi:hypothetical protein
MSIVMPGYSLQRVIKADEKRIIDNLKFRRNSDNLGMKDISERRNRGNFGMESQLASFSFTTKRIQIASEVDALETVCANFGRRKSSVF